MKKVDIEALSKQLDNLRVSKKMIEIQIDALEEKLRKAQREQNEIRNSSGGDFDE